MKFVFKLPTKTILFESIKKIRTLVHTSCPNNRSVDYIFQMSRYRDKKYSKNILKCTGIFISLDVNLILCFQTERRIKIKTLHSEVFARNTAKHIYDTALISK